MTLPSASTQWTWKTDFAMSKPIVVIVWHHKRTHAVQQLGYARSLWIKKKNTLRIVERPRLEARKKRLTKQQLSL
jgi:hypothetical protein